MQLIYIFLIGIVVLVVAIVLNWLANLLGLTTWYEFIRGGKRLNVISYVWLFLIYPFALGLAAYLVAKLLIK